MTPDDLAQEFSDHDFDYYLETMLDNVPDDIDKREGSVIYDAIAPAALVMAQENLRMATIIKETYVQTAEGEFLDYRAAERGTARYAATQTEVKTKLTDSDGNALNNIEIGDQFASIGETPIFYTVQSINEDLTVNMTADDSGTTPNGYLGQIIPVTPNDELSWAEITEIIAPARDEETDDHLRSRLLGSDNWIAYGGNVSDYLAMTAKINEVGATQVYPTWNGAGTVKLVILNNDLMPANQDLITKVKNLIDPVDEETQGYGLAPIDHRVTVTAPTILTVDITSNIQIDSQHNIDVIKQQINDQLTEYFKDLRATWNLVNPKTGRGYAMTIYRSKILAQIMQIPGVVNATIPSLNNADNDVQLIFNNDESQLPVLGEVTLNEQ